uniref:Major facilitator superfamily (MFS) profile domain-containing protein n=1 Tax=Timema tahoe TaxID=61484 RepID=A0A7R9I9M0_9NEOP|nr:unnamed protein product [Timema tahoe]
MNDPNEKRGSSSRLRCLQKRYIIAIMVSLGIIIQFLIKVSMSVAIVAMVKPTALTFSDSNSTNGRTTDTCPNTATLSNSTSTQVGEFEWSSTLQGFILSAFYYGYITTQIIGGRLGEKYGAKFIMGPGLLAAGIMSLLTPIAARYHVAAFAVVRILTGVFAGNVASLSPMKVGQNRKQTINGIKTERDQLAGRYPRKQHLVNELIRGFGQHLMGPCFLHLRSIGSHVGHSVAYPGS